MSAPAATSSRACAIAASWFNHRPPSENESSVTLTIPMTTVLPWTLKSLTRAAGCMFFLSFKAVKAFTSHCMYLKSGRTLTRPAAWD